MKFLTLFSCAAMLTIFAAGCVLTARDQVHTTYYDLAVPVRQSTLPLQIISVGNDTAAQSRMFFRLKGDRVVQDSLNCWVQSPERMLQRYLVHYFSPVKTAESANLVSMRCTINAFEFDMTKSEAVLGIKYLLKCNNQRQSGYLTFREKFTNPTPDELAAALSKAVNQAADRMNKLASEFSKKSL